MSSTSTGTWTNNNAYTFTLTGATSGELVRKAGFHNTNLKYVDTSNGDIPVLLNKSNGNGIYTIKKSKNIKSITLYATNNGNEAGGTVYGNFSGSTGTELISSLPKKQDSKTLIAF